MSAGRRWVLATGNRGKLAELRSLFRDAGLDLELVAQTDLGIDSAPEEGATFIENALAKARHAARASGLPAIADDSGLCVDALGGEPGVRSARYAGDAADDRANILKLLDALRSVSGDQRGAGFYCVLVALRSADDPAPLIASGEWRGRVAAEPRGAGGFGYDPVFVDPATGLTAAELGPAAKNLVSHRGQALNALAVALRGRAPTGAS
ncbi:MAG TPA: RdgB/HAM1 family non-canonical purine NTP pyrophosphatase [Gammaproteobacteria bacterium]|nr:RdgB/HAM1 family non-canonical purine NTP pyrophosphatase [Gammaproteobacteria bacterium]